jgi:hypothetical protein
LFLFVGVGPDDLTFLLLKYSRFSRVSKWGMTLLPVPEVPRMKSNYVAVIHRAFVDELKNPGRSAPTIVFHQSIQIFEFKIYDPLKV